MNSILIHPAYFPSIVQMVAVVKCSEIIYEIHGNYQKQTYRNRAYIAHSNGRLLLSVPVKHDKKGNRQKMNEVQVENDFPWQSHHWKSIQSAYRTSPFFEYYEDDLKDLFQVPVGSLLDHNLKIQEIIFELIGIETPVTFSESYKTTPKESDYRGLINVKKEINYALKPYTQVLEANHEFLKNLSILDLLFNEGPNTLNYLESQTIFLD